MIRRGDITDIAWVFARLEMKCLVSNQPVTALLYGLEISQTVFLQATKIWGL